MNRISTIRDDIRTSIRDWLAHVRDDRRGVAAVEFALILPVMLLLYIGTAEITQGLMANRKMTTMARALSDLVAQESADTGITDATLNSIFAAATAIMSPYSTASLKMTVSSIEFVPDSNSPPNYTAKTRWTVIRNGSTPRTCGTITKVSNNTRPAFNTMPTGLYGAGTVIVADVTYVYTPTFGGGVLAWNSAQSGLTFSHTTYMRPRSQYQVLYAPSPVPAGSTICP